jgi:hypothetical protein
MMLYPAAREPFGLLHRCTRGREQAQRPGAGVVPHQMESPGAGGDALVVTNPPGAVLPVLA